MADKVLNARMQQKHDIEANWCKAVNFIPLQGEIIVYDTDTIYNYERFKIGDGITSVNELPFAADFEKITNEEIDAICGQSLDEVLATFFTDVSGASF